jgi:hypothetical protein
MNFTFQTSENIQLDFAQIGIFAPYVHSTCCICLSNMTSNTTVIIDECKHALCKSCIQSIIDNNQSCPTCRSPFNMIITKDDGLINIYDFSEHFLPQRPMCLARQTSCGGGEDDSDHMKLIPSHPVSEQLISTESSQFNMLHSNPINGLGVVTMMASSEGIIASNSDILVVLDNSGSMDGMPLEKSKEAIIEVIKNLKPSQRLSVLSFNNTVIQRFPLQHVTPLNRDQLIERIQSINAYSGTIYTDSFIFAKTFFEESQTTPERKRIMLFFSDGEPNEHPNLRVIDELFTTFPTLILHTISMGNGVDASRQMVPLHRDRIFELGVYRDCSDMAHFSEILTSIVGNITATWATDITLVFTGATPLTSLAVQNVIKIPILNVNEALNIPYEGNPISISYSFTKDGEIKTGTSILDTLGVLPIEISIHYPKSKQTKNVMNEIITNATSSASQKQELLKELLTQIIPVTHGIYFDELKQTIETLIQSLEPCNQHNIQLQNRGIALVQLSSRQTSDESISRLISDSMSSYGN